jgi:ketosteroid isomerase-like protein
MGMASRWLARVAGAAVSVMLLVTSAQADTTEEVTEFMKDYLHTFDTGHADEIKAFYDAPLFMMGPNGDLRTYEGDKMRRTVKRWRFYLRHYGFERSEWHVLNVNALAEGSAVVSTVVDRYNPKGERFHRSGATYTLRKQDGTWKIFLIQIHEPEMVIAAR